MAAAIAPEEGERLPNEPGADLAAGAKLRDGQELLDASREFTSEDRGRSWFHFWSSIGIHVGLLVATALAPAVWMAAIASVFAGLMGIRMFIIYHDHQHGAILRKSKVADWVMTVFGLYILAPSSIWKRSHNFHHKHNAKIATSSIGSYPVMTVEQWEKADKKIRRKYAYARHPLTILFGYWSMFLHGMCWKSYRTNSKKHRDSLYALIVHGVLLGLAAWAGWQVLVFTLIVPLFIAHAFGAYLFYCQHNFPDVVLKPRQEWKYTFAALSSSSYFEMSPVMHYFTGNIGYHHVHHLNARIPFYRLPEAMEAMPELQSPGTVSWRPRDVIDCLRLKLWDPEQGRMVGFNGR